MNKLSTKQGHSWAKQAVCRDPGSRAAHVTGRGKIASHEVGGSLFFFRDTKRLLSALRVWGRAGLLERTPCWARVQRGNPAALSGTVRLKAATSVAMQLRLLVLMAVLVGASAALVGWISTAKGKARHPATVMDVFSTDPATVEAWGKACEAVFKPVAMCGFLVIQVRQDKRAEGKQRRELADDKRAVDKAAREERDEQRAVAKAAQEAKAKVAAPPRSPLIGPTFDFFGGAVALYIERPLIEAAAVLTASVNGNVRNARDAAVQQVQERLDAATDSVKRQGRTARDAAVL